MISTVKDQEGRESKETDVWFDEYDDAHRFYAYIKGMGARSVPYAPWVSQPPSLCKVPIPYIHSKGELTDWEEANSVMQ